VATSLFQERPSPIDAFPGYGEKEIPRKHVFVDEMEPPFIGCGAFTLTTLDETRVLHEKSAANKAKATPGIAHRVLSALALQGGEGVVTVLDMDAQNLGRGKVGLAFKTPIPVGICVVRLVFVI